jgi:hypothetical protein
MFSNFFTDSRAVYEMMPKNVVQRKATNDVKNCAVALHAG